MPEWKLVDAMGLQFKRWSGRECRLKDGLVTSLMWRDPSTINPQISRKHSISRKNWIKQSNINQWTKRSQKMVPETVHSETQAPRDIAKKTLPKHTDQLTGSHEIDRHRHEFTNTNKLIDFLSYSGAKSSWNTNWSWIFERIRVSVIQNGQNLDWIVRITEYPNTDTPKNILKSATNWSRLRQFEWRP